MSSHTAAHTTDPKAEARSYAVTLTALLILTTITVGAAYVNFGAFNVVIALTIATIKAILVALFFMHLAHDKAVNAVIAVAGFLFLGIFLMFDMLDFDSRENVQPVNLHPPVTMAAPAATAPAQGTPATPAAAPATPAK